MLERDGGMTTSETKRRRPGPVSERLVVGTSPRASIGTGVVLTAVAWLVSRTVITITWGPARNLVEFNPYLWARWDSINYLAIAQDGRVFGRCGSPGEPAGNLARVTHETWCGNAGWLPGYPWLIHLLGFSGLSLQDAGLLISWVAMAGALFVAWWGWCRELRAVRALLVLLLVGLFPGAVYNFAYFPTSLALLGVVGALLAAARRHFLVAALLMTLAGLCYPSAVFAAVGLAVGLMLVAVPLGGATVVRRGLWGLAGLCSLLVLGIHDQIAFGHADAFYLMDAAPGLRGRGFPGEGFLRMVLSRNTPEQRPIGRGGAIVLAVQGVLAVVLTVVAAVLTAVGWRRDRTPDVVYPALVGLAVIGGILVDQAIGGAWNRSVVLAAPCVLCLRRLPLPVLVVTTLAVGAVTALMSRSYFGGLLV